MSYAGVDAEVFRIRGLAYSLSQEDGIGKVLYYEEDATHEFIEYMNKYIKKCDVMLLFCSKNALNSRYVGVEWMSAFGLDKRIIPVFFDKEDIPTILNYKTGVKFNHTNFKWNSDEIYRLITSPSDE